MLGCKSVVRKFPQPQSGIFPIADRRISDCEEQKAVGSMAKLFLLPSAFQSAIPLSARPQSLGFAPHAISRVAVGALKSCDVAEVDRMHEGAYVLVADCAFQRSPVAKIDRMLERGGFGVRRDISDLIQNCVASLTVVSDDLSVAALVLAVVTTETALRVEVADVVRMCLPVGLHLRKEEIGRASCRERVWLSLGGGS